MALYRVVRTFVQSEYVYVKASSEEEAKEKAIDLNNWQVNDNDSLIGFDYVVEKDDENN